MLDYEEDKSFWDIGLITETAHKIICSFQQAMRLLCVLIDFNYLCFIQCCATFLVKRTFGFDFDIKLFFLLKRIFNLGFHIIKFIWSFVGEGFELNFFNF